MYDILYKTPRRKVLDSQLLNGSFKMSILDLVWNKTSKDIDSILTLFNSRLIIDNLISGKTYYDSKISGMQYNEKSIPQYLKVFIQTNNKNMNWFENEMRITDISGMGVVDLRDKE